MFPEIKMTHQKLLERFIENNTDLSTTDKILKVPDYLEKGTYRHIGVTYKGYWYASFTCDREGNEIAILHPDYTGKTERVIAEINGRIRKIIMDNDCTAYINSVVDRNGKIVPFSSREITIVRGIITDYSL